MRCEVIKARDGLELPAYLSLPVGAEPKGLPMILNVHGGPWARDAWGYRPDTQWFTNRGYAVLQVSHTWQLAQHIPPCHVLGCLQLPASVHSLDGPRLVCCACCDSPAMQAHSCFADGGVIRVAELP